MPPLSDTEGLVIFHFTDISRAGARSHRFFAIRCSLSESILVACSPAMVPAKRSLPCTGCTGTGQCPGTLSSALRTPASAVSRVASSLALRKPLVAAYRVYGWPENRSKAPFKVSGRDVADVTPQHLLLAQFLTFVLLRVVVVVLAHHRTTTVMAQL